MEEIFKNLAQNLEVQPSSNLWYRFQNQRKQPKKKSIWISLAASLLLVLTFKFIAPNRTVYHLQPLEQSYENNSFPIVSTTNYPVIEEGNGKIKLAIPIN